MIKDDFYLKIINDVNKENIKRINENKEDIIKAFISYYGEEYAPLIKKKYDQITFVWFIPEILDKIRVKKFKTKFQKENFMLYKNIHEKTIIGSTNYDMLFNRKNKSKIKIDVKDNPKYITVSENESIVLYPSGIMMDEWLIHEINHAITSTPLMYTEENNKRKLIAKTGLIVTGGNHLLEELFNELSSQEITKIFHKNKNIIFDDDNLKITYKNAYKTQTPLLEKIYKKHRKIIDKARLSNDKSLIYSLIDEENLKKLEEYLDDTKEVAIEKYKSNNPFKSSQFFEKREVNNMFNQSKKR